MKYYAIDLFSGVGGLSSGLEKAKFCVKFACEIDPLTVSVYKKNHLKTTVFEGDINYLTPTEIKKVLKNKKISLLAGCPPCQGFSSIRRLNRKQPVEDKRNSLINRFVYFIEDLRPLTVMMENVPGLIYSDFFEDAVNILKNIGYFVDYKVVNISDYGLPQNRKRLVLIGSRLGKIEVLKPSPFLKKQTVFDVIHSLPLPECSDDPLHKIFPRHTDRIKQLIKLIPKNGGSLSDLDQKWQLKCHSHPNIGFNDVYGRLRWNDVSSTITGGCLNPSKGRFLHPEQDRCISAREAALLQTFDETYYFPCDIARSKLALMIGNALPPKFCQIQAEHIMKHIKCFKHCI